METINVISPIEDKSIKQDIDNSPIWKEAYHTDDELPIDKQLYQYTIKMEGIKPVQVTKIKKL